METLAERRQRPAQIHSDAYALCLGKFILGRAWLAALYDEERGIVYLIVRLVKLLMLVDHIDISCIDSEFSSSDDLIDGFHVEHTILRCDIRSELVMHPADVDLARLFNALLYHALYRTLPLCSSHIEVTIGRLYRGWDDRMIMLGVNLHLRDEPSKRQARLVEIMEAMTLHMRDMSPLFTVLK